MVVAEQHREMLMQRVRINPSDGEAWYLLGEVLEDPAQRGDCQKLATAAGYMPPDSRLHQHRQQASPPNQPVCAHPGCETPVTKPGHTLCYTHWKTVNRPAKVQAPPQNRESLMTASQIGERLDLTAKQINSLFAELGWITKERNGWIAGAVALQHGAVQKTYQPSGVPYVLWPEAVLNNTLLHTTIESVKGEGDETKHAVSSTESGFRERFPAQHRAMDGHWVRSKAELLIDNWLYMEGIVHAYERRVPLEEELYCDFYLPSAKVYVEYWGIEHDERYLARKHTKLDVYHRHQLRLIELTDNDIRNLDDALPKLLLRFNVTLT